MNAAKRVLIVDDSEVIRECVGMALADEGYDIASAAHGAEALAMIPGLNPDLILLDMLMPVMDGWKFGQRYREFPEPRAPIIVLTAAHNARDVAKEVGAADYLAKPFELDHLIEKVNALIGCEAASPPEP